MALVKQEKGRLTKGVRCCQLLGSVFPRESLSKKQISMIRAAPAAIKVQPKTECTIVDKGMSWGCADMAQPVSMITIPGRIFRRGRPDRERDSHIPSSPAHHHTMPMEVCCKSLCAQG